MGVENGGSLPGSGLFSLTAGFGKRRRQGVGELYVAASAAAGDERQASTEQEEASRFRNRGIRRRNTGLGEPLLEPGLRLVFVVDVALQVTKLREEVDVVGGLVTGKQRVVQVKDHVAGSAAITLHKVVELDI